MGALTDFSAEIVVSRSCGSVNHLNGESHDRSKVRSNPPPLLMSMDHIEVKWCSVLCWYTCMEKEVVDVALDGIWPRRERCMVEHPAWNGDGYVELLQDWPAHRSPCERNREYYFHQSDKKNSGTNDMRHCSHQYWQQVWCRHCEQFVGQHLDLWHVPTSSCGCEVFVHQW